MSYSDYILTIWDTDKTQEEIKLEDSNLLKNFLLESKQKLSWNISNLNGVEYHPSKEIILKQFYSNNRLILGFSKIFKLKKLEHLCAVGDFIFDYSRSENTLSLFSMNYLARIILETSFKIVNDLLEKQVCSIDISSIVEESNIYLSNIYEQTQKHTKTIKQENPFQREYQIEEKKSKVSETQVIVEFEEPEELNIPIDKVGLISDFYEEAYQHLSSIGKYLIELESLPENTEILNTLFRSMHTIKGGARLLQVQKMEKLAHKLENLLDKIRSQALKVNSEIIDILLEGKNLLSEILEEIASKGPVQTKINPILQKVELLLGNKKFHQQKMNVLDEVKTDNLDAQSQTTQEKTILQKPSEVKQEANINKLKPRQNESIRVSTEKLDEVINITSELSIIQIQFEDQLLAIIKLIKDIKKLLQRMENIDFTSILNKLSQTNEQVLVEITEHLSSLEIKYDKEIIENIVKKFYNGLQFESTRTELTFSEEMNLLLIFANEIKNITSKNVENLGLVTKRIQGGVMHFRMVPLNNLFERYPTLVRDLARQTGKKVKLEIHGGDTELDRTIINQLSDPLLHILRNSIDHGIEPPGERIQQGKPEIGIIQIKSYYQGSEAIIEIKDDGKGLNKELILKKAIEKELLNPQETNHLTDKQIFDFILAPGFSTSSNVTELSGRGVGMDVVYSAIKELQGSLDIYSEPTKGTTILLKVPLTLAVVRVLLFETSGRLLALPMSNISEILRISRDEIQTISNQLIYELNREIIHLVHLGKVLEINSSNYIPNEIPLLILCEGNRKVGLIIDKIYGRQEIVIKNMGNLLKKVPFIMGCTILSDSKLVLVLNPKDVIDTSFKEQSYIHSFELNNLSKKVHNILVVDDSLVHRQNLKMILARAGYIIDEAENGFEALKMVRIKKYAILCVDVIMPLMDGIELTKRLRNLPLYRSIPILLITSKRSKEDRQRGFKSGANEYFEKPIDSEALLATINKYITEIEKQGNP